MVFLPASPSSSSNRKRSEPDPVLLQGREGRWRLPWVIAGLGVTSAAGVMFFTYSDWPDWLLSTVGWAAEPPGNIRHDVKVLLFWLPVLVAPLLTLWAVHRVSWRRAFSYGVGFSWRDYVRAALAFFLVWSAAFAVAFCLGFAQFWSGLRGGPGYIIAQLVVMLGAVFVQTLAEEVMFKGYYLRVLGAVWPFRLPLVVALIAFFTSLHLPRPSAFHLVPILTFAVVSFAIYFRTQNLAAATAIHWMQNVFAITEWPYFVGFFWIALEMLKYGVLVALLIWPRSPFYLLKAQTPQASAVQGAGGEPAPKTTNC
jgi:membrane protease YdiL (CAAX protease family)